MSWLLKWLLRAIIFFTLFAFALNNQHDTTLNFFFGTSWRTSTVIIVLLAFTLGVAVGVLGMFQNWLKRHTAKPSIVKTPDKL
ncbi:MAG TPA: lipopolysaccharide assembly protein LapA domain-containing protein [Burkholderiaceae bacterium]|nr:lipopolysaccharide assembly protein LapA domain-containing protein [Burkholderiaceae bacterium]